MKLLKKFFNKRLIWGGGILILICIIVYFLNTIYYKEYFIAPKGKGVRKNYNVPVDVTGIKPATGGKMAESNQVAASLNNQYENPTSADASLSAKAADIHQNSVAYTSGMSTKARPILMLNLASLDNTYQSLNDYVISNISETQYNEYSDKFTEHQKSLWNRSNYIRIFYKDNKKLPDRTDIKVEDDWELGKYLNATPIDIINKLNKYQKNYLFKLTVPTWNDGIIRNLPKNNKDDIKQFMTSDQQSIYDMNPNVYQNLVRTRIINKNNPDNFKKYISDLNITNLININQNSNLIDSLPEWKQDIIWQRLTSALSSRAIRNLSKSDYDLLEKYMTEAQKNIRFSPGT